MYVSCTCRKADWYFSNTYIAMLLNSLYAHIMNWNYSVPLYLTSIDVSPSKILATKWSWSESSRNNEHLSALVSLRASAMISRNKSVRSPRTASKFLNHWNILISHERLKNSQQKDLTGFTSDALGPINNLEACFSQNSRIQATSYKRKLVSLLTKLETYYPVLKHEVQYY